MKKKPEGDPPRVAPLTMAGARQDLPQRGHGAIPTDAELDALAMADMGIDQLLQDRRVLLACLREIAQTRVGVYGLTPSEYARRILALFNRQPQSTNAVDPQAQPSGTPTPRGKVSS